MDNGACSYRRYLDGDESAFDEIMDELFFKLIYFVDSYVHDIHAAEDIAMDAISDLFVHKHRYNFKVSLKTYVFMLGKSRALNYIKRGKALDITAFPEDGDLPDERASLEEEVIDNEEKRRLHNALGILPDDMREAVYLVYFEELTYEEAARLMKKNKKQIDNLLYRAKDRLRVLMGENGERQ